MDIKFISWNESQAQFIHALSMIISYLQRSNGLWCPTLVLLSQMRILLSLSVAMVTIETVGFKPRGSFILEMNFPLPFKALCTKS